MSNPTLSLTDFVDVILKSGVPKLTKVTQIKSRPTYQPAFDYYKQLREAIIDTHKDNGSKKHFLVTAGSAAIGKKAVNYKLAIDGYSKWWGTKEFTWAEPPRVNYTKNGVQIIVNPELGLAWSNQLYLIKLYLKSDPLSKPRADLILTLLKEALHNRPQSTKMAILDVRSSKLFTETSKNIPIAAVDAELAYISALWAEI